MNKISTDIATIKEQIIGIRRDMTVYHDDMKELSRRTDLMEIKQATSDQKLNLFNIGQTALTGIAAAIVLWWENLRR